MKKLLFVFLFIFNLVLLASCSTANDDYKITVVAPQGAPAVAVAINVAGSINSNICIYSNRWNGRFYSD